jgi:hypothetical protein
MFLPGLSQFEGPQVKALGFVSLQPSLRAIDFDSRAFADLLAVLV